MWLLFPYHLHTLDFFLALQQIMLSDSLMKMLLCMILFPTLLDTVCNKLAHFLSFSPASPTLSFFLSEADMLQLLLYIYIHMKIMKRQKEKATQLFPVLSLFNMISLLRS